MLPTMKRPNIIFILIDDMGWRDLACCGSTFYETPVLDGLAAAGMRFTNAYASCPVCSPSRASIMTGKYPARLGLTNFIGGEARGKLIDAPYVRQLALEEFSLARALREGGYTTWHVGKWHLGEQPYWPQQHGFDVNVAGCGWGMPKGGYFSPYKHPTLGDGPDGEYLTDRLTQEAINLIESHDHSRPFFLNLWHYAVHIPIQVPQQWVDKYRRKAARLGLDKATALVEGEFFPCEHKKDRRVSRRVLQSDPAYAGMVENLDWNIGRVLDAVRRAGQADNTIIIFTSDNGGLSTAEGAPTCNLPAAEGKGWMYDGGTRVGLLVVAPGSTQPLSQCATPVTSTDFYPTLLELAGLPPRPQQHCDGVSLAPLLRGQPIAPRPIFWHYPHYGNQGGTPGCSVRDGDWKLIEFFEDGRLELYNLVADPSESVNLAADQPQRAKRMHQMLVDWRNSVGAVLPLPNTGG
jgi:arylsulfatase A-like enzyme